MTRIHTLVFLAAGAALFSAAGTVSVLFARSYARADGIHRAMLARGFTGRFDAGADLHFQTSDALFLAASLLSTCAVRLAFAIQ